MKKKYCFFPILIFSLFLYLFQSCGVDVSKVVELSGMSLNDAVMEGDIKRVKQLINAGVDVNDLGNRISSPLLIAVQNFDVEMAQLLIDAGADVNFSPRIKNGAVNEFISIINNAVNQGNMKMVNLLINNGALADKGLPESVLYGNKEIVKHLINFAQFDDKQTAINSALNTASQQGNWDLIHRYL